MKLYQIAFEKETNYTTFTFTKNFKISVNLISLLK